MVDKQTINDDTLNGAPTAASQPLLQQSLSIESMPRNIDDQKLVIALVDAPEFI